MTTIDKLLISGIRSYDSQSPVVIRFFHPLTMIIGHNGSGKTTIIEALKYACTGEPPPLTDRGRTFLHDPKHCNESIVKAQIKIGLKLRDGQPVIGIHCLQLTNKKTKSEFKTLDSVVKKWDEGTQKIVSVSQKCADMKKMIPELMGVSKAILENVLFCHQKDLTKYLQQPGFFFVFVDLKNDHLSKLQSSNCEHLSSILLWSKALTQVSEYQKKLNVDLKDVESDLKVITNNLDHAHKLQSDLDETKTRMASSHEIITKCDEKLAELESSLEPLREKQAKLQEIRNKIDTAKRDFDHLKKAAEAAYNRMESEYDGILTIFASFICLAAFYLFVSCFDPNTEKDDELEEFLANNSMGKETKTHEVNGIITEREQVASKLASMKNQWEDIIRKEGQLMHVQNDFNSKQEELRSIINSIITNNQLTNFSDEPLDTLTPSTPNSIPNLTPSLMRSFKKKQQRNTYFSNKHKKKKKSNNIDERTDVVIEVSTALTKLLKSLDTMIISEKQKHAERGKSLQASIQTNTEQRDEHRARLQFLKIQAQENVNKKKEFETELKAVEALLKGNEDIDNAIAATKSKFDVLMIAKAKYNTWNIKQKEHNATNAVQDLKNEMKDLEKKKQQSQQSMIELLREMQTLQNESTLAGKLSEKEENIERMKKELDEIWNDIKGDVANVLDDCPPIEELDKHLRVQYDSLKTSIEQQYKNVEDIKHKLADNLLISFSFSFSLQKPKPNKKMYIYRMEDEKNKLKEQITRDMEICNSSDAKQAEV
ncbi:DNA recombination/repair protein [Reticulomyxa filosa]|uniref:DNA recombination/repair protein n=1 Tax=Reticulomyxa filosa TaxID=46433 RepID=X6NIX6_RETFI|nr:DNA recombination/repair protein [Reticulomyxa filosa]|eukprot:ETO25302.1 DNA recombination/repair protein [Reticulomyxa filosa]